MAPALAPRPACNDGMVTLTMKKSRTIRNVPAMSTGSASQPPALARAACDASEGVAVAGRTFSLGTVIAHRLPADQETLMVAGRADAAKAVPTGADELGEGFGDVLDDRFAAADLDARRDDAPVVGVEPGHRRAAALGVSLVPGGDVPVREGGDVGGDVLHGSTLRPTEPAGNSSQGIVQAPGGVQYGR